MTLRLPHPDVSFAVLSALIIASTLTGGWDFWGSLALAGWWLAAGALLGRAWLSDGASRAARLLVGVVGVIALVVVQGAVVYRLFDLSAPWTAALLGLTSGEVLAWQLLARRRREPRRLFGRVSRAAVGKMPLDWVGWGLALVVAALVVVMMLDLGAGATELSVRSPWDVVAMQPFFVTLAAAALLLVGAALGGWLGGGAPLALAAMALLVVSVARLTYAVGFGFDPYIHEATERAIVALGEILPKPAYYMGQYALVTVIVRVTGATVAAVDLWLGAAAFALAAPLAYWSLRRALGWAAPLAAAGALVTLLLPLGTFIMTTPQGLADALALWAAFLALPVMAKRLSPWPLALVGLATVAVHPITGVPLAALVAAALVAARWPKLAAPRRLRLALGLAVACGFALPALFIASSLTAANPLGLDLAPLYRWDLLWGRLVGDFAPVRLFSPLLDYAYAWQALAGAALLAGAAFGLHRLGKAGLAWPYLAGGGGALVAYVLLGAFLRFDFLIDYEQGNYAARLWPITCFLLAPAMAVALGWLASRLRDAPPASRLLAAVTLAGLIVASTYLAYPRRDRHDPSRGWSTSAVDLQAVRLIEKDAADASYVTLANQAVAAAAIREFGFAGRYVPAPSTPEGSVYFYPVPTSSPLYAKFIAMNQARGHRRLAELTLRWLGVDRVYYVVSQYWHEAGSIVPLAREQADAYWNLDNQIYVFRYDAAPR
jgi:hypothetical protein